jgi:hypothetical protein
MTVMLDDEQQRQLKEILNRTLDLQLTPDKFEIFLRRIQSSMEVFKALDSAEIPISQIHDRLRKLWLLAQQNERDPPIEKIRATIKEMPDAVIKQIERRVPRVLSSIYGDDWPDDIAMADGKTIKVQEIQTESWTANGGFPAWAENVADSSLLVRAVSGLTTEGGRMVAGRTRGKGKRSHSHFEPTILGVTKGANEKKRKGGRPRDDAAQTLVQNLALDWSIATDHLPKPSRSDTGFGELVHSVFSWTATTDNTAQDVASGRASYALRAYWKSYRTTKTLHPKRRAREARITEKTKT